MSIRGVLLLLIIVFVVLPGCARWHVDVALQDARISYGTQEEMEPSIAVDLGNQDHVVAAIISRGQYSQADGRFINTGCRISHSGNGGATWQRFLIDAADFDREEFSDPAVAIDHRGVSYVTGFFHDRSNGGGFANIRPMLARIAAGANQAEVITFDDGSGRRFDKPYVAAGRHGGQTRLYLAYTAESASDDHDRQVRVIVLDDPDVLFGGATRSSPVELESTIVAQGNNWGAHPAIGPDGEVYVTWSGFVPAHSAAPTNYRIEFSRRDSDGRRWSEPRLLAELGSGQGLNGVMRSTRYPVLAVSSGQVTAGWVFAAFADQAPVYVPVALPRAERINALRINTQGQVAGWFEDRHTGQVAAFRRHSSGTYDVFAYPDALSTVARGINEQGTVAGTFTEASDVSRGFTWREGSFSLVYYPGSLDTHALDIDGSGRVVGWFTRRDQQAHGFIREPDGGYTQLDHPGAEHTFLTGIGDAGVIVGYYRDAVGTIKGFRYQSGVWSPIEIAGASDVQPADINSRGEIVGNYRDAQGAARGFVLAGGSFEPVDYPGAADVYLTGINDAKEISGYTLPGDAVEPFVMTGFGEGHLSEIWMMRSANDGETWSWPVRVNHDTRGDQFYPWACADGDGNIYVAWLDRRDDPDNLRYHLYASASLLGSMTFLDDVRVTRRSSNPREARHKEDNRGFIGDYIGLACGLDRAYPAWPDLRDAPPQDIYAAQLRLIDP